MNKCTIKVVGMGHYEGEVPKIGEKIEIKVKQSSPFRGTLQAINKNGQIFGVIANSKTKITNEEAEFIYSASELKELNTDNMTIKVMGGGDNWLYAKIVSTDKEGESMERKIRKIGISNDNIAKGSMLEGFKELWTRYGAEIAPKPEDLEGVAIYLLKMGDYIAKEYLKGQKSSGEFDHSRVWYEYPVISAISYEMGFEIEQGDLLSEASLLASRKFLMEEEINEFLYKEE